MSREATPEEAALFHAANKKPTKPLRGGVPKNYPVPEGDEVLQFEDTPQPDDTAREIKTAQGVTEPGGAPAGVREATPEEVAAFHAQEAPAANTATPTTPQDTTSAGDLRHQFYRGVIPLPEKAINAVEAFGNAHDPFNQHGTYDEELARVQARQDALKQERPWESTGARILGAVVPGSALIKGGTNLVRGLQAVGPATRAATLGTNVAGAALGGGVQGGAQDGPLGAALGVVGGAGGALLGEGLSALARKFPWIADRLAERLTGQTAKQSAARVVGTEKGAFPVGDYANHTLENGLIQPTPGMAVNAGVAAAKDAGEQLKNMRSGLTVSEQELRQAIGDHPALEDMREALGLNKKPPAPPPAAPKPAPEHTLDGIPLSKLPPSVIAKNPELARLAQAAAQKAEAVVPPPPAPAMPTTLQELAEATNQNVVNPLNKLVQQAADPRAPIVSQSDLRALQRAKDALNTLQDQKILSKPGVNPGEYDAARKAYAIASGVTRGEARTVGQQATRKGRGALIGAVLGGPGGFVVGGAVGDRPAAYAALKAYQAARTAPVQMLAKAAKVASPAVAGAVARAQASGQPEQAGAAIQKAQANDPKAR